MGSFNEFRFIRPSGTTIMDISITSGITCRNNQTSTSSVFGTGHSPGTWIRRKETDPGIALKQSVTNSQMGHSLDTWMRRKQTDPGIAPEQEVTNSQIGQGRFKSKYTRDSERAPTTGAHVETH
jgi:hypothetical protein